MDMVLGNTVVMMLLFLSFFMLKIAGVVLRSSKVYHFHGTKVHLPIAVSHST